MTTAPYRLMLSLSALLILLCIASLAAGRVWTPLTAALDPTSPGWPIIIDLRLPRTILGVAVGAALGACGAALQGYTRNPLAEPAVLGVSSLASLGAVIPLYFGMTAAAPWLLPAGAMVGALVGVAGLLALSGAAASVVTFVLAGAVLNIIGMAGVSLALSLSPNPWAASEIVNWLLGSLADRSVEEVGFAVPLIVAGLALILPLGRALDALTLGEDGARSLGIDLARTRLLLGLGVGLSVGASVAVTGMIGFVGLVTPHLLRPLVGGRPGALIWPSALGGGALLLAADLLVRLIPSAAEMKLGVAMSVIGGPFFLYLLLRLRRRLA